MRTSLVSPGVMPAEGIDPERLLGWRLPERPPTEPEEWRELADRMARTRPDWQLLDPHVAVSKRGYTRIRLAQDETWELLLLGWLPGQHSSIHSHGGSAGISRVMLGELHEALFERVEGEGLVRLGDRLVAESQAIVEEVRTIHRMTNESQSPVLSLHLYSPPLRALVEYDVLEVMPEASATSH